MLTKYTALGGPAGKLGWPRKAATVRSGTNGGTVQAFQKGTVYVSAAGTAAILAPVYAEFGVERLRDRCARLADGRRRHEHVQGRRHLADVPDGRVVVAGKTSTTVTGDVLAIWLRRGADANVLGWPTGDAKTVTAHGSTGTVQPFQQGDVVIHGKSYTVSGAAGLDYVGNGGPTGTLGWPTGVWTSTTANGGGGSQRFAGGAILLSPKTGAHALSGAILALYDQRGGVTGSLGWPSSTTHDSHGVGGTVSVFTSGRIYSSKVGTVAVRGDILAKYLQKSGTAGVLGWPTSNATTVRGAVVQTFQHGKISYTAAGGAKATRS